MENCQYILLVVFTIVIYSIYLDKKRNRAFIIYVSIIIIIYAGLAMGLAYLMYKRLYTLIFLFIIKPHVY